jgi:hypothetical protein
VVKLVYIVINKPAKAIELPENDLRALQSWVRAHTTPQQIVRCGVFRSVPELIDTSMEYIVVNNEKPKPFVWTAGADAIIKRPPNIESF